MDSTQIDMDAQKGLEDRWNGMADRYEATGEMFTMQGVV